MTQGRGVMQVIVDSENTSKLDDFVVISQTPIPVEIFLGDGRQSFSLVGAKATPENLGF